MRVKEFVRDRSILWWSKKKPQTTWAWALAPMSDGRTRLVSRVRSRSSWAHPSSMLWRVVGGGGLPMMRKCLLGIKRRAEGLALEERGKR